MVQAVLSVPGRAFVLEIEAESIPGVSNEVMNRTKPIKGPTELTTQQWMKALSGGDGRGDLECPVGANRKDQFFVAFVGP